MSEQITLYALVDATVRRRIHAICGTAEEAEKVRRELLAMVASAPGLRRVRSPLGNPRHECGVPR